MSLIMVNQLNAQCVTSSHISNAYTDASIGNTIKVDLSWSGPPIGEEYQAQVYANGIGTKGTITTGTTSTIENLLSNTEYQWRVRVKCNGAWTSWPGWQGSFTTPDGASCEASGHTSNAYVDAANGNTVSVDLSWTGTSIGEEYQAQVYANGIGTKGAITTGTTSTIENLLANTDYQWRVRVKCNGAWTSWPGWQGSFTTPDGASCEATGHTSNAYVDAANGNTINVDLSWTGTTIGEEYQAQVYANGIGTKGAITTGTTSTIENLLANTDYQWRVRVKCNGQWATWPGWQGSFTTPDGASCETSGHTSNAYVDAANGNTINVDLSWTGTTIGEEYQAQVYANGIGTKGAITIGTTSTIENLLANTDYQWRVRVKCNGAWTSWPGWQGSFTTPDGSSCEASGHTSNAYVDAANGNTINVDLSWTGTTIGEEYQAQVYANGIGTKGAITTGTTSTIENLLANTDYQWRVRVKCNGQWATWPGWQGSFTTPDGASCETSGHLASVNTLSNSTLEVDLSWGDLGVGEEYQAQIYSEGVYTKSAITTSTSTTISNVNANAEYIWRVRVKCNGQWATWPGWQGIFSTPDGTSCMASGLSANPKQLVDQTVGVDLTWDDLGVGEEYQVQIYHDGVYSKSPVLTGTSTSFQNLNANAIYQWRVRVKCNGAWTSWPAWQDSFTTPDGISCEADGHTANVSATGTGTYRVDLDWDDLSVGDEYQAQIYGGGMNEKSAILTSSEVSFENLTPDTRYQWRVRVKCNGQWASWPAWQDSFTTPDDQPRPFITTWKTDNPGSSSDTQILITTTGSGYNYTVTWEEVGNPANNGIAGPFTGDATIDFPLAGTYQVSITGLYPQIYFPIKQGGWGTPVYDWQKLLSVDQWGDNQWKSMHQAFASCSNLVILANDQPNLHGVTDMSEMFYGASSMNEDISGWDLSNISSMNAMFRNAISFNQNIGNWNVSNVTAMSQMFYNATSFNQDIGEWDISSVEVMNSMFYGATSFDQDIGSWNVNNVTQMEGLFYNASSFNQDISSWDVGNISSMNSLFLNASSFNQNIGSWDVSNVINMSGMFNGATSFNQDISGWDVSNVKNMSAIFANSSFNQDISSWNVGSVEYMASMFMGATSFNQDISSWDVRAVIDMHNMFNGATSFNQDISQWDVSNVVTMREMFKDAIVFNQSLGSWDISSVTLSQGWTFNNMTDMLSNSGLSPAKYESTLEGWSTLDAGETQIPMNLTLGADGLTYCDDTGRNTLINTYGWTITDAGQDCGVPPAAARTGETEEDIVMSADGMEISITMYPNPANEWFTLRGDQLINGTIQILDLNGKVLRAVEDVRSTTVTIDIYDIKDGVYLLKVDKNGHVYERKLVIKH